MSNVRRERAPAIARRCDHPAPVVLRGDGLTAATPRELFGAVVPGCRLFAFSKGAVSAGDVVRYMLEVAGPAEIFVATWTVSPVEIRALREWVRTGAVRSLRLLLDPSFVRRHPAYTAELRGAFGPDVVRLAICHAKVATVVNDEWALVLRTSANLNHNARTEYYELEDNRALAGFVVDTLSEWFGGSEAADWTARPVEHRRRFDAWHAAAPRALTPAGPEDAAYFGDGAFDQDVRRSGLSYLR